MSATHDHAGRGHRVLVYHDAGQFADRVGAFAREGLRRGDHLLAAVTPAKADWLREELGDDARVIEFIDADTFYDHHGRMFRILAGALERYRAAGQGHVRLVAEQALAERRPADVRAYMRYEAASNVAFRHYDASVLCPYDAERLPEEILRAALKAHPEVLEDGGARRNDLFVDPRAFVRESARAAPPPAWSAPQPLERAEDVAAARALVRAQAQAAGLREEALEGLSIAVSEVATNAVIHGAAPRCLWSYVDDGYLVCHVRDAGRGLRDPLAGYLPPDPRRLHGRGLWLAHQVCDIVEVADEAAGTNVYLRTRLPAAA